MVRTLANLPLDGGCIVFNFTNTVNSWLQIPDFDYLKDYRDLLAWSEKVNLLDRKRLKLIEAYLETDERNGDRVFKKLIRMRELLHSFFSTIAKGNSPGADQVKSFNAVLAQAHSMIKITIVSGETKVVFVDREVSLEEPLWKIVHSAYEILTEANFDRIRECPGCGWLFLDTSKNGKRRWCNMQVCGSNDKALRYYYRSKS